MGNIYCCYLRSLPGWYWYTAGIASGHTSLVGIGVGTWVDTRHRPVYWSQCWYKPGLSNWVSCQWVSCLYSDIFGQQNLSLRTRCHYNRKTMPWSQKIRWKCKFTSVFLTREKPSLDECKLQSTASLWKNWVIRISHGLDLLPISWADLHRYCPQHCCSVRHCCQLLWSSFMFNRKHMATFTVSQSSIPIVNGAFSSCNYGQEIEAWQL